MSKKLKKHERRQQQHVGKISRKAFDKELRELQTQLCHLQAHVQKQGLKVIVIFEGRDAAGKGGVIKRITERVSSRVFRVVALPTPSDRQKSQWYPQRYIEHFPAAGEVILFDRSWYNRAGVERVMNFCTDEEYEQFLRLCPLFEEEMIRAGIILVKYFFDVSKEVQEERFKARIEDPMRHWKLSPMDVESWKRWHDYTAAYEKMLEATDTKASPWYRVAADDKRRARLNCISHLLSVIPYKPMDWQPPAVEGLKRNRKKPGTPEALQFKHSVPQVY